MFLASKLERGEAFANLRAPSYKIPPKYNPELILSYKPGIVLMKRKMLDRVGSSS